MTQVPAIDGTTRLYAIIGDPVSAVRSPEAFNAMFARQGINAVMVAFHVPAADFRGAWDGLRGMRNLDGLVITMPHKVAAAALVDELGPAARVVGAINTVKRGPNGRWIGDMFDGAGCVEGLLRHGHQVKGRRVFLLGAGGAGAAIAAALAAYEVGSLAIHDVDPARLAGTIAAIASAFPSSQVRAEKVEGGEFDIAINATPLGMKADDPLPFDPAILAAGTLVVDVVTKPEMTPLLQRAQSLGHAIQTGRYMHHGQAVLAARFLGFDFER